MAKFKNTMGITNIKMFANLQAFCTIGKAFFTASMTIELTPGEIIPDYIEVEDYIRALSGQTLLIEDCVDLVFNYVTENYKPLKLVVSAHTGDAKHMPVTVEKQS